MSDTQNIWFKRGGEAVKTSRVYNINLAKGTGSYDFQDLCHRCGGVGGNEAWKYTGWTCFDCGGTKLEPVATVTVYTAERLAVLNAAQAKRDAAKAVKFAAAQAAQAAAVEIKRAAFEAANPDLIATINRAVETVADPFLADMASCLRTFGSLSDKQLAVAKTYVDRFLAREAARAASQYVGTVGERRQFTLTCEHTVQLEAYNSYLPRYAQAAAPILYLCRDEQGNRVVYKGTGDFPCKGETAVVTATVKEHKEYRDEHQTVIARPKVARPAEAEVAVEAAQ